MGALNLKMLAFASLPCHFFCLVASGSHIFEARLSVRVCLKSHELEMVIKSRGSGGMQMYGKTECKNGISFRLG